jgi:hypothetical protein
MSDGSISPSSREQLAAIASLARALGGNRIEHWLFGGWAVDFWTGAVTRRHDDIDVAAWRRDVDAIKETLEAAGWHHTPRPDDRVGTCFRWHSTAAELTFVVPDGAGGVVPLPDGPVVWSTEPFGDETRELQGVTCRYRGTPCLGLTN